MTGVLTGVRVVELASWTYVPAAGVALADWSAGVIEVESVLCGDPGGALVVAACSLPSNTVWWRDMS